MVPEWFKLIGLICFSTILVTAMVCLVYGIVRITFMVIQDYKEEREMKRGKPKHLDQR